MQSIVLAYDDTPSARGALASAATLAGAFDAKLTVASVAPVLVSVGRSGGLIDSADPPERHAQALERARSFLREHGGVEAEYVNLVGPPADTIVRLATRRHADLIVVGSRRPSLAKRLFGQSVSESVVHKARCPVLVVCEPKRAAAPTSDEHDAAEPLKTRERIAA
jgi:nucleotide-binding universal stress UspA family protein